MKIGEEAGIAGDSPGYRTIRSWVARFSSYSVQKDIVNLIWYQYPRGPVWGKIGLQAVVIFRIRCLAGLSGLSLFWNDIAGVAQGPGSSITHTSLAQSRQSIYFYQLDQLTNRINK